MKEQIQEVLSGLPVTKLEQTAGDWVICIGGTLSGSNRDGVGLATRLRKRWEAYHIAPQYAAEPVIEDIPPQPLTAPLAPQTDYEAIIADLKAQLAKAEAKPAFDPHGEPQPVEMPKHWSGDEEPPAEYSDIISYYDTPAEAHEKLQKLFMEAKQSEEIARSYGGASGMFNGKTAMEWLRKAERIESGINWNRGRLAGTL